LINKNKNLDVGVPLFGGEVNVFRNLFGSFMTYFPRKPPTGYF